MRDVRQTTCQLIEHAEDGLLTWEAIARAALCYLSEDDVREMARMNELLFEDEENEALCEECGLEFTPDDEDQTICEDCQEESEDN